MSMDEVIRQKLEENLKPIQLEVKNESDKHIGHAGHDGGGESHFRVVIVSSAFEGLNRVARQRLVFDLLKEELASKIHALSLKCITPNEDT